MCRLEVTAPRYSGWALVEVDSESLYIESQEGDRAIACVFLIHQQQLVQQM